MSEPHFWRADLHVHTSGSKDAVGTGALISWACRRRQIDCIAITDHNSIAYALALKGRIAAQVIVGEEVLTRDGEMVGLFLSQVVPAQMSILETIDAIHEQGGLACLPHPFAHGRRNAVHSSMLADAVRAVDIVEIHNARAMTPAESVRAAQLAIAQGKAASAGSDAHTPLAIGRAYVELRPFRTSQSFMASLRDARIMADWQPTYERLMLNRYVRRTLRLVLRQRGDTR